MKGVRLFGTTWTDPKALVLSEARVTGGQTWHNPSEIIKLTEAKTRRGPGPGGGELGRRCPMGKTFHLCQMSSSRLCRTALCLRTVSKTVRALRNRPQGRPPVNCSYHTNESGRKGIKLCSCLEDMGRRLLCPRGSGSPDASARAAEHFTGEGGCPSLAAGRWWSLDSTPRPHPQLLCSTTSRGQAPIEERIPSVGLPGLSLNQSWLRSGCAETEGLHAGPRPPCSRLMCHVGRDLDRLLCSWLTSSLPI